MTGTQRDLSNRLRLWPGIVIVALMLLLRFGLRLIMPDSPMAGFVAVFAGLFGGVAILIWWLFFSRARWSDRLMGAAAAVVALAVLPRVLHASIAGGMMGFMPFVYAVPVVGVAFVGWAAATRHMADGPRRAWMVLAILLACGVWTVFRVDGITGDGAGQFAWRWTPTPEEELLARNNGAPALPPAPARAEAAPLPEKRLDPADAAPPAPVTDEPEMPSPATAVSDAAPSPSKGEASMSSVAPVLEVRAEWPGFRGPGRDGVVRGVQIRTDWTSAPPVELWRKPIGPGWSSFAVRGNLVYTQEQRGDSEIVACYDLATGEPVWAHRDAARFWEANAGPGPRATPTLSGRRVYTFGATGIVNALDAATGAVVWSRNASADTGTEVPGWGFASSPLVIDGTVIVATAGTLAAYGAATGEKRWVGPDGGAGYSSPHLVTIDGVTQVVLLSGTGVTSFAPADGTVLWRHELPRGTRIVQPNMTEDGDLLVNDGDAQTLRRISVARGPNGWTVQERWASMGLKPYFNDFVVHDGHAYGFDGSILSCVDLSDGTRTWKGGRYGHGQLVLLRDQDVLLVLTEEGGLALVRAAPDAFVELARVPAIEGKTWNHPVLVGDVLLVRNDQEMAAFRLSLVGS